MSFGESSIFWGIIGLVGGLIVATFFYFLGKKKVLLEYSITSTNLISKQMPSIPGMSITLDGKPVECLTLSKVKFINSGNQTIYPGDFAPLAPLAIITEGNLFSSTSGFRIDSDNPNLHPSITVLNNRATLSFDFIKPKESFSITILHDGKVSVLGELTSGKNREVQKYPQYFLQAIISVLMMIIGLLLVKKICEIFGYGERESIFTISFCASAMARTLVDDVYRLIMALFQAKMKRI
ncbi:MAG: hypothetical protein HFF00_04795 [Ruminiclostridium sp.]|jgi:hypothetical protein|nr:hypothetical protein [Ruminiclostridium sp.]